MKKGDVQLAKPQILYKGTTAAIEALTGVVEGAIAYSTDDNLLGTYDGATWNWGGAGATQLVDLTDVNITTPSDKAVLSYDTASGKWIDANLGVTNGDSHDHVGGDGATLDFTPSGGWISVSATWTRTGNHTFTVSGDVTATYRKGARVRYKDGGSFEYGVIESSSYSAPDTTVTLFTNTDYAMAAATITDTALSYIENPIGYPHWFNYTPTYGGTGSLTYTSVTTDYARFAIFARTVIVRILTSAGTTGGTTSAGITATLPYSQATGNSNGYGRATDTAIVAAIVTSNSASTIAVRKYDNSNWGLGTGRTFSITHIGEL